MWWEKEWGRGAGKIREKEAGSARKCKERRNEKELEKWERRKQEALENVKREGMRKSWKMMRIGEHRLEGKEVKYGKGETVVESRNLKRKTTKYEF
jgi:hypothetical protein